MYTVLCQELVSNVIKHAQATEAEVQLTKHSDYLNIVVTDNGIGLDTHKKPTGIGLRNIQERLQKVKGAFSIDSSPQGTSVNIDIPLPASS